MVNSKIIFISIKNTRDASITLDQKAEALTLNTWISKIKEGTGIFLSSPIYECIEFASIISGFCASDFHIVNNLSDRETYNYLINTPESAFPSQIKLPDFDCLSEINDFIQYIEKNSDYGIIFLEEKIFLQYNLDCKTRELATLSMNIYINNDSDPIQKQIAYINEELNIEFSNQFFQYFSYDSNNLERESAEMREKFQIIPSKIANLSKNIKESLHSDRVKFKKELEKLSQVIKTLETDLLKASSVIKNYYYLVDLYTIVNQPNGQLIIKGFNFDKEKNY